MRKVFLDDLPRWKKGEGKGKPNSINWNRSVGCKVPFIYDDVEGEIEIISYDMNSRKLKILWDNEKYDIFNGHFAACKISKILKIITKDFKFDINYKFKDNKRDLIVVDREYRRNPNNTHDLKWYKYKCNKCGWSEGWTTEGSLVKGVGCACCAGKVIIQGINDIPTTDSWMVDYFQGGYDEAKQYSKRSSFKIKPICPNCKSVKDEFTTIASIYTNKTIGCKKCGSGISYPERVMYLILKQLCEDFKMQLSKTTFEWCNKYKYDFYIPKSNVIIETHGIQHYKDCNWSKCEDVKENDRLKNKLAVDNGINEYIIIDCQKSELKWIKENIFKSKLKDIFDLSIVDWDKINKESLNSLVNDVCTYKNNNDSLTIGEVADNFGLDKNTIRSYYKKGNELGLCDYNKEYESKKGREKARKSKCKSIDMFEDEKYIGRFESSYDIERKSLDLFGVKLFNTNITQVCKGIRKTYKGFTFKYI